MAFIVKNKQTGCFLAGDGAWTQNADSAQQFPNGMTLVRYLNQRALGKMEDVLEVVVGGAGNGAQVAAP